MTLEILSYGLDPLANTVTDNQKQNAPSTEVDTERVVEGYLIDGRIDSAHQI